MLVLSSQIHGYSHDTLDASNCPILIVPNILILHLFYLQFLVIFQRKEFFLGKNLLDDLTSYIGSKIVTIHLYFDNFLSKSVSTSCLVHSFMIVVRRPFYMYSCSLISPLRNFILLSIRSNIMSTSSL